MTGRFSSAVGTTRDDSKDRPPGACISYVVSVRGPTSVCQIKAPLTSAEVWFVEMCEAFAVTLRAASPCQLPASRPAPCPQARKGERRGKNPFLFAMLFEKNIEIFSAPNPSVLCVFSICLPRFRAWTGSVGSAGTHHDAGLPEISGAFGVRGTMIIDNSIIEANGAFRITETSYDVNYASFQVSSNLSSQGCTFYASRNNVIYGSSPTVMPASVNLPAILYLGEQS